MTGKGFKQSKQLKIPNNVQYRKATNLFHIKSTFVSLIYTSPLAGNTIVYTAIQGINREKYFNHFIYKGKVPILTRKKHLSVHFFFHRLRFFHLSTE